MSNAGTRHSVKRPRNRWAKNYTEQGQGQACAIMDLGSHHYTENIDCLCSLQTADKESIAQWLMLEGWAMPGRKPDSVALFACAEAKPHTDDAVTADVTIGVVLQGHHDLITSKSVGDLLPGSVFALHNKKRRSAKKKDDRSGGLVFLAADYSIDWPDYWHWLRRRPRHA